MPVTVKVAVPDLVVALVKLTVPSKPVLPDTAPLTTPLHLALTVVFWLGVLLRSVTVTIALTVLLRPDVITDNARFPTGRSSLQPSTH